MKRSVAADAVRVGVAIALVAFINRDKPDGQRGMSRILTLAVMQVVLGAVAWIAVGR